MRHPNPNTRRPEVFIVVVRSANEPQTLARSISFAERTTTNCRCKPS